MTVRTWTTTFVFVLVLVLTTVTVFTFVLAGVVTVTTCVDCGVVCVVGGGGAGLELVAGLEAPLPLELVPCEAALSAARCCAGVSTDPPLPCVTPWLTLVIFDWWVCMTEPAATPGTIAPELPWTTLPAAALEPPADDDEPPVFEDCPEPAELEPPPLGAPPPLEPQPASRAARATAASSFEMRA
jgi:hypothetical protein